MAANQNLPQPPARAANQLDQCTYWIDSAGHRHAVAKMDPIHAANAAGWLRTNAVQLLMRQALETDTATAHRIAEILADPNKAMRLTPLHQRLAERAAQYSPSRRRSSS